jgi:arylsulfatase A-like enzyme
MLKWVSKISIAIIGLLFVLNGYLYGQGLSSGPNFILISVDTLRADHLGCYGYFRNTSPNIDKFAKEGILFRNCVGISSWTLPSHLSMLTGLYPISHGANTRRDKLIDKVLTLPEALKDKGYVTAGFVSGYFVSSEFGYKQQFDIYDERYLASFKDITSDKINEAAISWLKQNFSKKFFLFIHYYDVHFDYIPPPPYNVMFDANYQGDLTGKKYYKKASITDKRDLEHMIALYDGEIRWTDSHIGKLLEEIERLGVDNRTVIILTSDHGDEFLEHGRKGHGNNLYETTIHTPFILKIPGGEKGVIRDDPISPVDIMPTLLALAGVHIKVELDGRDLTNLEDKKRAIFSELNFKSHIYRDINIQKSIRLGRYKMIFDFLRGEQKFFDLKEDPQEKENLMNSESSSHIETKKELAEKFFKWLKVREEKQERAVKVELDDVTKKQLKSLGYL